jgi:pyruvate dehydrogenase E1 component alpha subunit
MHEVTAGDIQTRGPAFGVPSNRVDGQDVQAVYHAAKEMVDRARKGEGPGYLVCDTYRYHGHHIGDINREYYRSKAEETKWKERDPIALFSAWITSNGIADKAAIEKIDADVKAEVEAAVDFAVRAPYPSPDEVTEDIYA